MMWNLWLLDDAILRLCAALPIQGEYGCPCKKSEALHAALRIHEHSKRNGQTIRRNSELLGKNRASQTGNSATIGIFLITLFFEIGKTTSNPLLRLLHRRFAGRKTAVKARHSTESTIGVVV